MRSGKELDAHQRRAADAALRRKIERKLSVNARASRSQDIFAGLPKGRRATVDHGAITNQINKVVGGVKAAGDRKGGSPVGNRRNSIQMARGLDKNINRNRLTNQMDISQASRSRILP